MTTLSPSRIWGEHGAGNRIRTGDLNLGKVALYQLSYSRTLLRAKLDGAHCIHQPARVKNNTR